jgi:DNA-binding CsgD family transcriptional regulator
LRLEGANELRAVKAPGAQASSVALTVAGAVVTAGSVELSRQRLAGGAMAVSAVEQGLVVMRSVLAHVKGSTGPGSRADVRETIALVLVELGDYDCAVVWRVDGLVLVPVAVAFAPRIEPFVRELERLVSAPPLLHECWPEGALIWDAEVVAAGTLGSGGPMEPVLGPLSYAVAAVKSGRHPAFLLQAMYCERRAGQFDLELLMSVAQLVAALDGEPAAAERRSQSRGQAGANNQDISHHNAEGPPTSVRAGRSLDDGLAWRLNTLTSREREVLDQVLTGATYITIADALFISSATIHSHMQSIRRKLGVHSRAELMARYAGRDHGSLPRVDHQDSTGG